MPFQIVAMRNPLKQGLKLKYGEGREPGLHVAMRNPLKQGLKLSWDDVFELEKASRNAKSTKTRIETSVFYKGVLVFYCRNAKSTKTRIET